MSELTLKRLEYFSTVADEGNITRAARNLHISQPALSLQLKMLEDAIGQTLLTRTPRGVMLTSAGSALRAEAETILNQARLLTRKVSTAGKRGYGTLSLGVSPVACEHFLPFVLARFREQFPGIEVRVVEGDATALARRLEAKTIDLAITRPRHEIVGQMNDSDWETNVLLTERLILAAPRQAELADRLRVSLADLAGERLIMYSRKRGARYFDAVVTACRDRGGFDPTDVIEVDSIGAQIAMIAAGCGVGFVTDLSALRTSGDVIFRACDDLNIDSPTVMISRQGVDSARAFGEIALEAVPGFVDAFAQSLVGVLDRAR